MPYQELPIQQSIPWIHGAAARPIFEYLDHLNVDPNSLLNRNRLPAEPHDLYRDVFSQHRLSTFICDMADRLGKPSLGRDVIIHSRRSRLDWAYSSPEEPTLFLALKRNLARTEMHTSTRFGLSERGESFSVFRRKADVPADGDMQFGIFAMEMIIDIVRSYLGRDWYPAKIWVPGKVLSSGAILKVYSRSQILPEKDWRFEITRREMAAGFRSMSDEPRVKLKYDNEHEDTPSDTDFTTILGRILEPYLRSNPLSLENASEILRMSPRTMQRRLKGFGLSFSEVLDEVRFDRAKRLLRDRNVKIIEISQNLGFESPSNFSRSFRRVCGVSPREYRRSLHELS